MTDTTGETRGDQIGNNYISSALGREARMLAFGLGGAVSDVMRNPGEKAPEVAAAATIGGVMGSISRLGVPGKVVAASVGTVMLGKGVYDEVTGQRWSTLGSAMGDTWKSGANMEQNIAAAKSSIGALAVDLAVGTAGFKVGSKFLPTQHNPIGLKLPDGQVDPMKTLRRGSQADYHWIPPRGISGADQRPSLANDLHSIKPPQRQVDPMKSLRGSQTDYPWIPPRGISGTAVDRNMAGKDPIIPPSTERVTRSPGNDLSTIKNPNADGKTTMSTQDLDARVTDMLNSYSNPVDMAFAIVKDLHRAGFSFDDLGRSSAASKGLAIKPDSPVAVRQGLNIPPKTK